MEDTQDFARHDKVPSGRSAAYGLARLVIHVGMYVLCRKDVVKVLETVVDMTGCISAICIVHQVDEAGDRFATLLRHGIHTVATLLVNGLSLGHQAGQMMVSMLLYEEV
jgi:hypothetical protein